jgi:hypothetical protein
MGLFHPSSFTLQPSNDSVESWQAQSSDRPKEAVSKAIATPSQIKKQYRVSPKAW